MSTFLKLLLLLVATSVAAVAGNTAVDDSFTTQENHALTGNVLANDSILQFVNVALGKTAIQSSTLPHGTLPDARKAVDGNTNGFFNAASTTHTGYIEGTIDPNPWWEVDLGGDFSIDRVKLWNRQDCCSDRLRNAIVDLLDGSGNVVASGSVGDMAGVRDKTVSFSNEIASKVRVSLPTTGFLQLAEVEVFSTEVKYTTQMMLSEQKKLS